MEKLFIILILPFMLLGCSDGETQKESGIPYKITKDVRTAKIKREVEVELGGRVSADELSTIAKSIKNADGEDYERIFIGYKVLGVGGAYWATTNYDPDLQVNIIGNDEKSHGEITRKPEVGEGVIGRWLVSHGLEYTVVVYNKGGKVFVTKNFGDGSSSDDLVKKTVENGSIKLQSAADESHGEFFIITKNGELELWGSNGKFATAKRL